MYGGSIENRMRFGLEIIRKVRETIGDDVPLGVKPIDDLTKKAEEKGINVIVIGDAKKPRKLTEAIKEGFEAANQI